MLVARLFSKPIILNYHSGEADDHLNRAGTLTRRLLHLTDRIIVPSQYLVEAFHRHGYHATAIANNIDLSNVICRKRSKIRPKIIVPRALEPLYDIPCALKAFVEFSRSYPDATMTVLGEGSQREYLQDLVSRMRIDNNRVRFTGRVERDRIWKMYDEHDIFLNTSAVDNMPVSILEAFAAGLPVVTTAAGGIPYFVSDRENGHVVPVGDHQKVASRLLELMQNPAEVERLSIQGQTEARKYTWKAVGPQWTALYGKLVAPSGDGKQRVAQRS